MKHLKHIALALLIIILWLAAGRDDLAIAQQENEHWCLNISEGVYFSSQEQYIKRCGGE